MKIITLGLLFLSFLFSSRILAEQTQYTCKNFRTLGYSISWSGDLQGAAVGERGGHYWAFNGQSIVFNMQTSFRKDIGQVWFAHPETDITYSPGNEYQLTLGKKKSADHAKLQINDPWFEGVTLANAGYLNFSTHSLSPVESPCLQGEGEATFIDADTGQKVILKLQFAIDVSGRKFRG